MMDANYPTNPVQHAYSAVVGYETREWQTVGYEDGWLVATALSLSHDGRQEYKCMVAMGRQGA